MRSAIVGCGTIAKLHADVIRGISNNQLVALCDTKLERAIEYAKEYGDKARAYATLEEMLEKEKIDILHICTPHYLHVPMAIYGLTHGSHVFMEKPPAITREQFLELELVKHKRMLGICFQNRYNKSTKAVKEILQSVETGKIKGARAFVTWSREAKYYLDSEWRGSWSTEGGGTLINQAIHTIDLLVQFVGKPLRTEAHMINHRLKNIIEVEDTFEAFIEFEAGPVCVYATNAFSYNAPIFIELECENVIIRLEDSEVTCIYPDGRKEHIDCSKGNTIGKDYWGTGHSACIQDFYNCVEEEREFSIQLDNVKDTFALVMDIYESAREKKVVEF